MPKKSTSARGGAHRSRPKGPKNIALVTSNVAEQEIEEQESTEEIEEAVSAVTAQKKPKTSKENKASTSTKQVGTSTASKTTSNVTTTPTTSRSSGRSRQRVASQLITAEHFAYVRKDLITIAILASLMFAIIIVLYITLGSTL